MFVRDQIVAGVRVTVKWLTVSATAWVGSKLGVVIDHAVVLVPVQVVAMFLTSVGLDRLAGRFPIVNRILSLGLSEASPSYGSGEGHA